MSIESPNPSRWTLVSRHLGWEVRVFDELDSTNTHALSLADDPKWHGLIILARAQTAGRGQYGRIWSAPPRSSVLASLLVFPPPTLRRPVVMTAWAAVAVCDVLQRLAGLHATIKWPNDILVDGKKVCGFLIEQRNTGHDASPLATVVGIGLNVSQLSGDFEAAGLPDAASISSLTGRLFDADVVAREVFLRLDEEYERLLADELSPLESEWQYRIGLLGKRVIAETVDDVRQGEVIDIGFESITLKDETGLVQLTPETIRHLTLDAG